MRLRKIILFLAIILMSFTFQVCGASYDLGIVTESVPEEQKSSIIAGTDISILTSENGSESIACFDVNECGIVAIGFDTQPRAKVYLYDADGAFLYGYEFNCEGSFGIEFVGDNIAIFFVRGDYIEIYDPMGANLDVQRVFNVDQNQVWRSRIIYPTQKAVGGACYHLERDIGLSMRSYSRLIRTDEQGRQNVIYDVSTEHNLRIVGIATVIIFFVSVVAIVLYRKLQVK